MEENKKYSSFGYVLGLCWDNTIGAYESRRYYDTDLNTLKEKIEKDFESGALDSGAGFQRLLAAMITVETISSITVEDKIYSRVDYNEHFNFGDEKYIKTLGEMLWNNTL